MKFLLCILFFSFNVYAADKLYLLPEDEEKVTANILKEIQITRKKIVFFMENFDYDKIVYALIRAKERHQLDISVYLDFSKNANNKMILLLKSKGIKVERINKKIHGSFILFDEDVLMFGSLNLNKKAFKNNYEVLMFTDEIKHIKKVQSFINTFKKEP